MLARTAIAPLLVADFRLSHESAHLRRGSALGIAVEIDAKRIHLRG